MSLINEALKQLEQNGSGDTRPSHPPRSFAPPVKNLYERPGERKKDDASQENLQPERTGLAGALILGICLTVGVTTITYYSLPKNRITPVQVKADPPGNSDNSTASRLRRSTMKKRINSHVPGDSQAGAKPHRKSYIEALRDTLIRYKTGRISTINSVWKGTSPSTSSTDKETRRTKSHSQQAKQSKKRQFVLGAVLASDRGACAIINNQMVSVGDEIDGAKVIEIGKHHVILLKAGKRIILRL